MRRKILRKTCTITWNITNDVSVPLSEARPGKVWSQCSEEECKGEGVQGCLERARENDVEGGVRKVMTKNYHFSDSRASEFHSLSRELVELRTMRSVLAKKLAGENDVRGSQKSDDQTLSLF